MFPRIINIMSKKETDTRTRRERANDRDDVVYEVADGLRTMYKWVVRAGLAGFIIGTIVGWFVYGLLGAFIGGLIGAIVSAILLPIARVIGIGFFD
jgi:predicted lipid-binding transport protein (Tim44 family)